jgi:hypothetical protein
MSAEKKAERTEGPYYVSADDAHDCPPHRDSGLAMVDTGRANDWPIARLCEWHNAEFIARACNAHGDLLAALRGLLECTIRDRTLHGQAAKARELAQAAVTKAEG